MNALDESRLAGGCDGKGHCFEFYNAGVPPPRHRQLPPPAQLLDRLREFVAGAAAPAAIEPGELPFVLDEGHFDLRVGPQGVLLEAWDTERNLARRLVRVVSSTAHKLELESVRFGGKAGRLSLVDLDHGRATDSLRQASRDVLRERLRVMAARQFGGWRVTEVTSGADLQHSLSPAFARGVVRKGDLSWAVLAAPESAAADSALTFGLIWLQHLRERESPRGVEGLALFLPAGKAAETRIRLACLHRRATRYRLFSYDARGVERMEDLDDTGNLDTQVEPAPYASLAGTPGLPLWIRHLAELPDVEAVAISTGHWSLRVRGLEFASIRNGQVWAGIERASRVRAGAPVEALAARLAQIRSIDSVEPGHPWRTARPESWLESLVRANPAVIEPSLQGSLVYGQVPNLGGAERGLIDLLAIDVEGRLCVIELKASEDPGLPVQALDYWWRVARHLERGDFQARGYFAGRPVRSEPPRLILVAPALAFHPTTETLLASFAPFIDVERVGLDVEWQARPRVVMRVRGARRPEWNPAN